MRVVRCFAISLLSASLGVVALSAATNTAEQVTMKEGKVWSRTASNLVEILEPVLVAKVVVVSTNSTFRVSEGKERKLQEGQVLRADGTLLSADGSLMPVEDHIMMKAGRPILVRDGEPGAVSSELTLGDGSRVAGDGTLTGPDGRARRLLDGQLVRLSGESMPVQDTVTLKNGKVVVQKDGSLLDVPAGRTLMMSDGTRVSGDGTVRRSDGTTSALVEGEVVVIQGVVSKRR